MSKTDIKTDPVPAFAVANAGWEICPECGVEYDLKTSVKLYAGTDKAPHFGNGWIHCSKQCASGQEPIQVECDEIFPD